MKKKTLSLHRLLPVICAILALYLAAFATNTFAATGNTRNKGAQFPNYSQVKTIYVSADNFDREFYDALEAAEYGASNSVQYKIILPKGTFTQGHAYTIPSNTYVYAVGTTINTTGSRKSIFRGNMSHKTENIIVEGGIWSTLSQTYTGDSTCIRFTGVKNLMLKNVTVNVKRIGHIIEVADINGFTMTGCTLSGNNLDTAKNPYNVQPKEALQLDIATRSAIPGYNTKASMYNGKGCHNVLITNNTFVNCGRGLGSHSGLKGAEKDPYTYITVKNNVIRNCIGEGIYGQNWKNTTIYGNTIQNCKQTGILIMQTRNVVVRSNRISQVRRYTGKRQKVYDPKKRYGCGVLIRQSKKYTVKSNRITNVTRKKNKGIVKES